MNKQDDLLLDLKGGMERAYKSMFYIYFSDLVYYAHSILRDREAAEDLVQELFVSFWYEKKYNDIHSGLESYLYCAVRNKCLNYLRNEKRKNERLVKIWTEQKEEMAFSPEECEEKNVQDELFRAIHHLPEQCKKIFILCALEGKKYQEAADLLGISINTVRTQMGRAYKSLRDSLCKETFSTILFFIRVRLLRNNL